ncbi:MAG: response regulator transcription factor [Bacteroidales bacterium]|nr:response regulator transcription factor [Bacteroidales bacterium]
MKKIRVVIVDDEIFALKNLEFELNEIKDVEIVGKTNRSIEVVDLIQEQQPDLLFLDINMPQMTGIQVIDELHVLGICPPTVLVTAHAEYAFDAFDRFVFNYLLKPVDFVQLNKIINWFRMNHFHQHKKATKLKFNNRAGFLLIDPDEIMAFKAGGNYSTIFLNSGKKEMVTGQLGKIEEMLKDLNFFRASQSCIINMDYLSSIDKSINEVTLVSGDVVNSFLITRKNFKELEELFK